MPSFVDDLHLTGAVWLGMVRSPFAHARIGSVDASAALGVPGVRSVLTGLDLRDEWANPMPCAWPVTADMKSPEHFPVAIDKANYLGDIVAVVVADSRYAARDGVDAVVVDYDPLPVVVELEDALSDRVVIHESLGTNTSYTWELIPDEAAVDAAFAAATHTISETYVQQRLIPDAMEPRGVAVVPAPYGGEYTIYSATQIPHILKVMLGITLGVSEHKIRVIAPAVGGGFGSKLNVYAEELIAFAMARRLGVPARWTEDRSRERGRHDPGPRPDPAHRPGRGRRRQGHRGAGAAAGRHGRVPAAGHARDPAARRVPLPRRVRRPELLVQLHVGVHEQDADRRVPGRGPARGDVRDRAGDGRAGGRRRCRHRRDPAAQLHPRRQFPYSSAAGLVFDSGNYEPTLDRALELVGYEALRAEQARRREAGERVHLGIGIATYVEMCGLAPSRVLASLNYGAGGWESATVRLLPTGKAEVVTGSTPHGQGHETCWSMIVADRLGIAPDDVEVLHSDTAISPLGLDTYGSRSLAVGGVAIEMASQRVLDKARAIAAHQLEAAEADLEFVEGEFRVKGTPSKAMAIQALAFEAFTAHNLPDGMEPNLTEQVTYDPPNFTFPFGTHVAVVEVDAETGSVSLLDYAAVDDCGNQINPLIVDGQIHGGIVQGVAQALWEEAVYDDDGILKNPTMADYMVPSSAELPSFKLDRTVTPSPTNSLGVKGIGEAGTIGSAPTVINAIVDALAPYGVTDIAMPASPERVWAAIHAAPAPGGGQASGSAPGSASHPGSAPLEGSGS